MISLIHNLGILIGFLFSFKNCDNDPKGGSFVEYYMPLLETIMSRNDYYTTGSLLDYLHHQNHYELTGIDLSRQTNTTIPNKLIS